MLTFEDDVFDDGAFVDDVFDGGGLFLGVGWPEVGVGWVGDADELGEKGETAETGGGWCSHSGGKTGNGGGEWAFCSGLGVEVDFTGEMVFVGDTGLTSELVFPCSPNKASDSEEEDDDDGDELRSSTCIDLVVLVDRMGRGFVIVITLALFRENDNCLWVLYLVGMVEGYLCIYIYT